MVQADIAPPYTVTGSVDIEVSVTTPTPCVVLHADKMNITSVSFTPMQPSSATGDVEAASIGEGSDMQMVEGAKLICSALSECYAVLLRPNLS